ncbi:MAG TPA: hypothetical protein VD736_06630 [Nitrososphaera sp.]|nr:hypothetical protein [Nitrososphaera sp.]
MAKASVKTLTLVKSRDIVVEKLLKPCEEDNHSKCTGWAVLKKEISPIDVNYFLKCTCACHHKKASQQLKKKLVSKKKRLVKKKQPKKKITKKKTKRKQKARKVRKVSRKSKRGKKTRRR